MRIKSIAISAKLKLFHRHLIYLPWVSSNHILVYYLTMFYVRKCIHQNYNRIEYSHKKDFFFTIFAKRKHMPIPLAEQLRPHTLDEYIGQEELTGSNGILRKALQSGTIPSMILWGPPELEKPHWRTSLPNN